MAVNPDKNAVEQGLIARLIGKIKRIALDISDDVSAEETRAMAAEAAAKTVVTAGENCSVTKNTAEDGHDVYTVNADGKPQEQADWNQADSSKVDYIKNKPDLGLKADKVQGATAGNLAALDASGNITDSGKKATDFATDEQGGKADSAVQGVKVNGTELSKDGNNKVDVTVPTASTASPSMDGTASAGNSSQWARGDHRHPTDDSREAVSNKAQVVVDSSTTEYPSSKATADFVNSSIATNTANFLGTYDVVEDLGLSTSATNAQIATAIGEYTFATNPTNNDYVFAAIDLYLNTGADEYRRFKFNGTTWAYEYTLNNSSFTAAQWAAINSGLSSSDKATYDAAVSTLNTHVADSTIHVTSTDKTTWNNKQDAISTDTDSSTISDSTTIATGYSSDKVHLNTAARLWDYIQNKISTVLGLTASKYNGIAETAVKLPLAWGGFDVQEGYRLLANITAPGAWNDRICTFNVFKKQAGQSDPVGQCGILTVQIRNSNNTFSYGVTYNRSANNRLDIVARSNTDKSVSLYVYSSGDIYGGLQLELVSSSYYTGNPTGREGITLYNNNSIQSTITGDTVTINYPITYLENDSVTADKVKDNETLPVNITGYASHLRQARCRFGTDETGYKLMAYLPPESGYSDAVYVFNIYEARDAAILDKGVLKGTLSICIRNNNGSYQYSSSYTGYSLSDIGLELRVDESLHGVRLYAAKSNQYYCTAIYELLNAYQLNGPEMNPLLYNNNHLSSYIGGTVITPTVTLLKQSGGTIPLADNNGVGSTTTPVYVNSSGRVQACDNRIHDLTLQRKFIRTNGEINGRNLLCDRQNWTGTAANPEFATVDPYTLAEWINRGDVIQIDFTTYDWWGDKFPGLIVEAQCSTLLGEDRLICTNLRVLRQKIVNQRPTVDFQWSNLITDQDTGIKYMEFQSIF